MSDSPEIIIDTLIAYQKSAALKGAIDLDLFTSIGEGAFTAADIAVRCDATERGVRSLCDYLVVSGFLTKNSGGIPTTSRKRISTDGAFGSRWTRGGREIVYRNGKKMMSATFDRATGDVGIPTVIFEGPYAYSSFTSNFDVTPDGQRFLMVKIPPESAPREITVVLNWFEELRRTMGN